MLIWEPLGSCDWTAEDKKIFRNLNIWSSLSRASISDRKINDMMTSMNSLSPEEKLMLIEMSGERNV